MADLSLRRIERAAVLGDPQAQGHLIRQRIRAGALTRDRVRLLAALGDAGAASALGADAPVLPREIDAWGRELAGFGREVAVRTALAGALVALPAWESLFHVFGAHGPHACLDAAEAWLDCPCRRHTEQARRQARALAFKGAGNTLLDMLRFLPVVWTGVEGTELPRGSAEVAGQSAGQAARCAVSCVFADEYVELTGQALAHARAARGGQPVRSRVSGVLCAWAVAAS